MIDDDPWKYARQDEHPVEAGHPVDTNNKFLTRRKYLERLRMVARLRNDTSLVESIDTVVKESTDEWLDGYAHDR